MRFTLFKNRTFEVTDPEALIEAYCFQSNFYAKYDLKRPRGDASFEYVRFIGARIEKNILDKCRAEINHYKDFSTFDQNGLDWFLRIAATEERDRFIFKLAELTHKLDKIPRVGLSKATKILHTRYPEIIPIIDNPLQREYKSLRPEWKKGDWHQLFKDYYDNFLVTKTYNNLCKIYTNLSFLNLTKVRIFDILWWSFLKSKNRYNRRIDWKTIRQVSMHA